MQGNVCADARIARIAGIAGRTRASAAADQSNCTSKPTNNRFWEGRQADRRGRLGGSRIAFRKEQVAWAFQPNLDQPWTAPAGSSQLSWF